MINSLLDFSRVEAGKMSASYKETTLQKVTADMPSLFRSAIEKGGVKYEVLTDGKEELVWIDHAMWEVSSIVTFRVDIENRVQRYRQCVQVHTQRPHHS